MHIQLLQQVMLNTIQDLVFVIEAAPGYVFRYVYMNKKAMRHAGLDESSYGKTLQEVLPARQAARLQQIYTAAAETGTLQVVHDPIETHSGEMEHYESVLNPVTRVGEKLYIVCITRNVTDWIRKQEELLESQKRYSSLMKYNSDAIVSVDLEGCIIGINPAAAEMFHCPEEACKGWKAAELIHPKDEQEVQRIFEETVQGKPVRRSRIEYRQKDGLVFYMDLKTIPIIIQDRVKGVYFIARDVTQQLLDEWKTEYFAYYDQLTGLQNRISLSKAFDALLEAGKRIAVYIINLNEFRTINEVFGHEAGDRILQQAADRAVQEVGDRGQVFRRHGNQFVLLAEQGGDAAAAALAECLLETLQKPFSVHGEERGMKVSIGIACNPRDGEDEQTLMKHADMALEKAREQGSGCYCLYDRQFDQQREKLFMLESQLSRAIQRQEFALYYQPQVHIETGEVIGWEALLRWHNQELGFIAPGEFIPLAEKTGFILQIDEWVIFEACRQLREWLDQGLQVAPVSVNISASQFRSSRILELTKRALQQYRLPARLLGLEITEGALAQEEHAEVISAKLREIGVAVHLDDFGTGYSSLSYLKRLPIDTLKIDRSFIRDVEGDEYDAKITTAIIHLARSLGMRVIVEGVENEGHIRFLRDKMAWYAQGYYFAKPLPVAEVEKMYLRKV
ncbi:putative bifunctional diguanylate cyclase/phosphodiesterase [Ectobacillus ponti]|uniref:EAL domain-containing protein n=1 Tax=Ectobacillus ponti TaxID=2961894 RepID=A0AA42BTC9_9BACI|nr:EAL domain-containing protein [Ectobacillus ponti]MCP8969343.1 EAL domain-containing protein [Ectobacillus ponti]